MNWVWLCFCFAVLKKEEKGVCIASETYFLCFLSHFLDKFVNVHTYKHYKHFPFWNKVESFIIKKLKLRVLHLKKNMFLVYSNTNCFSQIEFTFYQFGKNDLVTASHLSTWKLSALKIVTAKNAKRGNIAWKISAAYLFTYFSLNFSRMLYWHNWKWANKTFWCLVWGKKKKSLTML